MWDLQLTTLQQCLTQIFIYLLGHCIDCIIAFQPRELLVCGRILPPQLGISLILFCFQSQLEDQKNTSFYLVHSHIGYTEFG